MGKISGQVANQESAEDSPCHLGQVPTLRHGQGKHINLTNWFPTLPLQRTEDRALSGSSIGQQRTEHVQSQRRLESKGHQDEEVSTLC